jgi:diguanylate cyclase (GGDEF)-like protein
VALDHTEGEPLAIATNLAYPLGDVVLFGLVAGVFWLAGRDAGLEWLVIGLAFLATGVADAVYLWTSAVGTYQEGSLIDVLWPLMGILLAVAAWVRPGRSRRIELEGRPLAATPVVCTLLALVVVVDDHFRHLNLFALVLAAATIGFVLVRTLMTFRENTSIAARIQVLSVTDPLTHLWNRRRLVTDLEAVFGSSVDDPHVLVLYDLNGFKRFNDLFGHPAGDALLARLAAKLTDVVDTGGMCYRLGGDEFCVLARVPEGDLEAFLDATSVALSEAGDGFEVTTSLGCVFLPEEATDSDRAMQIADQRLYARKHHSLIERGQPHGVLLQALYEREPDLRRHVGRVSALSVELGHRLELDDSALEELELAAQLHDIGKLAIPDAILDKPEPLAPAEVSFVQRHTVIGERILSAAPALSQIGVIVRATHEAFDGSGYPDALAGTDIPLAARIIAVCDTYSAITSDRPYQPRRSHDEALILLRSVAGSQLDPELVELFCLTVEPTGRGAETPLPLPQTG